MLAHAGHRGAALNFTKEVEGKKVETQIEVVEDILTLFTEELWRHLVISTSDWRLCPNADRGWRYLLLPYNPQSLRVGKISATKANRN